ncbi:antifreeze protein [Sulfitobacter sp. S190]|uniref:antifreeze protein n=1 Tax=Sulfitobacter sp. S190 TaxID=2867022 RepID=UPI0021A5DFD8|nr:antifreeze protein [Sulfitobacter sp. S190]UWR21364.1 antifreeze protein [Sulfitobacter sp. S190]
MKGFLPVQMWANAFQIGMVAAEAQAVIGMRMLGMAGIWSVTRNENNRMLSEKAYALTKSGTDAARVMARGGPPEKIAQAAIKPIRQTTRANAKRLAKRGTKKK